LGVCPCFDTKRAPYPPHTPSRKRAAMPPNSREGRCCNCPIGENGIQSALQGLLITVLPVAPSSYTRLRDAAQSGGNRADSGFWDLPVAIHFAAGCPNESALKNALTRFPDFQIPLPSSENGASNVAPSKQPVVCSNHTGGVGRNRSHTGTRARGGKGS